MFSDIIGHQKNIEYLQNTLLMNRVAQAYLFAGPPNVGKEFVAVTFAKALNCVASEADACNECLSCRKINDNNHPDVQIIRPEGTWFKIDQIRRMQKQISYRSMEGRYKVYILTDVEQMTLPAANSFLKTLEEPPGASVLILLTANYNALLPTIRSRCQLVRFSAIPPTMLQTQLMERLHLAESTAKQITFLSGGKVGMAFELARASRANAHEDDIDANPVIPGMLKHPELLQLFAMAEELNKQPERLDTLLIWYRDLLLIKQGCNPEMLTYTDAFPELTELAKRYSRIQLQEVIKTIMHTKNLLQRNINSTLALEVMTLKLIAAPSQELDLSR